MDALDFIKSIASFCESIDHHPDIHLFYNKILFELQRFDVGGKVTDKDFMAAEEIEKVYKKRG
jgi:4a-hydroxytetrahydrobiopterin dehydratase